MKGIFKRLKLPWQRGQSDTQNLPLALTDSQRKAEAGGFNKYEKRRFKTEVVGDLFEPKLRTELVIIGYVTTLSLVALFVILGLPLVGMIAFLLSVFGFGIRKIRTVHNGLLYVFGRRTRIGFWEGYVWVPWFIGGRLKEFNIERFTFDIPREDFWSKDSMHIICDIVIRLSVASVAERPSFVNLFWCYHVLRKTDTYWQLKQKGLDLGEGLFQFIRNADVENVIELIISRAKQATREVMREKGFEDIFHFENEEIEPDAEKQEELENEIKLRVIQLIEGTGMAVADISLADIDFHPDMAEALQQKKIAPWMASALRAYYQEIRAIAQSLVEDRAVGEIALKVETIASLKKAAESGILGEDLLLKALEKALKIPALTQQEPKIEIVSS